MLNKVELQQARRNAIIAAMANVTGKEFIEIATMQLEDLFELLLDKIYLLQEGDKTEIVIKKEDEWKIRFANDISEFLQEWGFQND